MNEPAFPNVLDAMDADLLQSALLEPRTAEVRPLWRRILGAIWRWM